MQCLELPIGTSSWNFQLIGNFLVIYKKKPGYTNSPAFCKQEFLKTSYSTVTMHLHIKPKLAKSRPSHRVSTEYASFFNSMD